MNNFGFGSTGDGTKGVTSDAARDLLWDALAELTAWIEARDYAGFDPYDGLNLIRNEGLREIDLVNLAVTQVFKKSPVDLRERLSMPHTKMPKAVGLCLSAYGQLAAAARRQGDDKNEHLYLRRCAELTSWLGKHAVSEYGGQGWNFGFRYRFMDHMPTVVITAVVARGLFDYHRLTGDPLAERLLIGACTFVLTLLNQERSGIWFSYTPKPRRAHAPLLRCCHNASMLGAEILGMGYAVSRDPTLRERVQAACEFTVQHQKVDGRWNYSVDLSTGRERRQVDFHQGFILDSLQACMQHAQLESTRLAAALRRGAEFYRTKQFTNEGRALWRLPRSWPADIHCQAQGIITFSKLAHLEAEYRLFAQRIALWTVKNMQASDGYFIHRKGRLITNNIPYMRWGQAWMMLALTLVVAAPGSAGRLELRDGGSELRTA